MTPAQCRAARALVDMSQAELARSSIVSRDMIADFETGIRLPSATDLMAMRQALEAAGVDFRNGDQPGVRLRK
jgi:transcriptional regulator with XRE-family HTH domain